MKKPQVSIIIGTLNQCETLKKVLPYYEKVSTSFEDFEVIVVDSTSSDGSVEFLANYNPIFQFRYHVQENTGKASARNKAASMAKGDIILVTDADMIPGEQFIQGHLEAHNNSTEEACFEGLAWNLEQLEFPPKNQQLKPQVDRHPKHMTKLGWYYFLTGNISIPRRLFDQEKGFNEAFKGYGWEDLELGYRLYRQKVPLYYLKTSENYHYHVVSNDDVMKRNIHKGKSARLFLKLHPELKWFLGFNPLSTFIFPKIKETSLIFKLFQSFCYKSDIKWLNGLGYWFLQEYFYLKGALNKT